MIEKEGERQQPDQAEPCQLCRVCLYSKSNGKSLTCFKRQSVPNPGIKLSFLHCRQILYHLSYKGSPIKVITLDVICKTDLSGVRIDGSRPIRRLLLKSK